MSETCRFGVDRWWMMTAEEKHTRERRIDEAVRRVLGPWLAVNGSKLMPSGITSLATICALEIRAEYRRILARETGTADRP